MNRKMLLLLLGLLLNIFVYGQSSGRIYFANGKCQEFIKINNWSVNGRGHEEDKKGLIVKYNGAFRRIPFQTIKEFKVLNYSQSPHPKSIKEVEAEITTKNGLTITATYKILQNIEVHILDELTDRKQDILIWFADNSRLNIKKVIIN
ncbi:MAG: hypothetical protein ACOC2M_01880 [bacterium]